MWELWLPYSRSAERPIISWSGDLVCTRVYNGKHSLGYKLRGFISGSF